MKQLVGNPLSSEAKGDFCGQFKQSVIDIIIVVQFGSPSLVWQKIKEPLTQGANLLGVIGVKEANIGLLHYIP